MALNDDWLTDVRRWYFDERDDSTAELAHELASDLSRAGDSIGYEAALPAFQWSRDELDAASNPTRGSP